MILLGGKNKSEANFTDEENSRKSHGGTAWEKVSPKQGNVFTLLHIMEGATAA